jgi:hypothetical protein
VVVRRIIYPTGRGRAWNAGSGLLSECAAQRLKAAATTAASQSERNGTDNVQGGSPGALPGIRTRRAAMALALLMIAISNA